MPAPKIYCFADLAKRGLKKKKNEKTGCLEWQGYIMPNGYGQVGYKNKHFLVHRLAAFFALKIPLDSSDDILHSCDNRKCFEPNHLSSGTRLENMQDARQKGVLLGARAVWKKRRRYIGA